MACVCSRSYARSDWPIVGIYSPVMLTGRLRAYKDKAKSSEYTQQLTSSRVIKDYESAFDAVTLIHIP